MVSILLAVARKTKFRIAGAECARQVAPNLLASKLVIAFSLALK
jgi:hypothetical protein